MKRETILLVQAHSPAEAVQCVGFYSATGDAPPDTIQLFPPGQHTITAKGGDGKPLNLNLTINEDTAKVIKASFAEIQAAAEQGQGPKAFLDFNHDDAAASAWVQDVFWAGEDPKTGGVRAKVEWSAPGAEAIKGKTFRQFSPNFLVGKESKRIIGTSPNMGGLVNRPAFKQIEPLFAKQADATPQPNTMKKLHLALVAAGLVSATTAEDNDLALASEFEANYRKLKTQADKDAKDVLGLTTKCAEHVESIKAKDAELGKLALVNAETAVAKAVAENRISPKDDAEKQRWISVIAKNPENVALLDSIPVKAAVVDVTKKVVVTKGTGNNGAKRGGAEDGEHEFMVKAKALVADKTCKTIDEAIEQVASSEGELYDAYRKSLLYVEAK